MAKAIYIELGAAIAPSAGDYNVILQHNYLNNLITSAKSVIDLVT